jgi:transcription elongation factor GreA
MKQNEGKVVFTRESYDRLKKEYEFLSTEERMRLANKLNDANDFGDLPENAAWLAAREESDLLEIKISNIKQMLENARIVDSLFTAKDVVDLHKHVELEEESGIKLHIEVVPNTEIDVANKKFGLESPLVKEILGRKKGEMVKIKLGNGIKIYTIKSVKKKK